MPSVTGTGAIGASWQPIAGSAITGETTTGQYGFGVPTLDGTALVTGAGAITFSAASVSGAGEQTFTGTAAITTTAASFSGVGSQVFSGIGTWTGTAAAFGGTGTIAFIGVGAFTSSAALLSGAGKTLPVPSMDSMSVSSALSREHSFEVRR